MRVASVRNILLLVAFVIVPQFALGQSPRQSGTLTVSGFPGQVSVIQVSGKSYVEVEALARLTNGSMTFRANQIILTLPISATNVAPPDPSQLDQAKFSRSFLTASVEWMTAIREWRFAIVSAIKNGVSVTDDWVVSYRRTTDAKLALASAAIITDADRSGFALLGEESSTMQQFSDKYVALRKTSTGTFPDELDNDPLNQQILSCARDLAALAASGQYQDVPACH
jgi:hypothetical protein